MKVAQIFLHLLQMELKAPFTTSFGTIRHRTILLVEAIDSDGAVGWGESVAFQTPLYNEETVKANWYMLEEFLIPAILNQEINHPDEVSQRFSSIRKNLMAKSAIEGAIWDLYANREGISLSKSLGGTKKQIEVGISIGIHDSVLELLQSVDHYVSEGYRRIKLKIKPGWDLDVLREVRKHFPDTPIMADANSAYSLPDLHHLKGLDEYNLTMIEQPLASDDIIDHATLQANLNTPICLDESIHSVEDARKAIELGSCKIINIKIGRVGGLTEARRIHDYCMSMGVPVWCGGMLESGIGRAHNIAITSLDNFTMPGDTAGSSRYWYQDIIEPEVEVSNGLITVPSTAGIGYTVNRQRLKDFMLMTKTFR
ncbi:o-succinylbenzoate synthase [Brevibacillus invocatus]|uniref:o-succinylbenzoate synthase n=1 Tax=Brevibacillus invocatus TaxID=173959 RepID=UPI0020406A1D|nr:o-succinylbenzoate synthase [Brevibacillus invocatus]MCM3080634.1 o-succinylbenzoate synthase [Brevibacillus invocatus]MCM3432521.1 o-succinylbenzoate synthase [Brevibacillus invocatus]